MATVLWVISVAFGGDELEPADENDAYFASEDAAAELMAELGEGWTVAVDA